MSEPNVSGLAPAVAATPSVPPALAFRPGEAVVVTDPGPLDEPGPRIVYVSPTFTTLTGYRPNEVIGRSPRLLHGPDTHPEARRRLRVALERRQPARVELVNYRKGGDPFWMEVSVFPLYDGQGRHLHWVGVQRDVGDRHRADLSLRDSETLLQTVYEQSEAAIFVLKARPGGEFEYAAVNPTFERVVGAAGEQVVGRTSGELPGLFTPEDAAAFRANHARCAATAAPVSYEEYVRLSGRDTCWVTRLTPLADASGAVTTLLGMTLEVTELRRAERAAFRDAQILAGVSDAVILADPGGVITYWNPGACAVFGYTAGESLGRPLAGHLPEPHRSRVGEFLARVLAGEEFNGEWQATRKGGAPVWVDARVRRLTDGQGRSVGVLGLARDVSERKRAEAEREQMAHRLQEGHKLESLGVLAGGIAQRFNNLLTGVLGNVTLAEAELPADAPARPFLRQIEQTALQAADLCRQMLAYSGRGRFVLEPLDLNRLLAGMTDRIRLTVGPTVLVQMDLAPALPPVVADARQLQQLVAALVGNAAEAMGEAGGTLHLGTRLIQADRAYFSAAHLAPELPDGLYVVLEVRDTGPGVPPQLRDKIFDPFFTTKFTGRGLGLSAALGIVRGQGGALAVRSAPGQGAIFEAAFPVAESPPVPVSAAEGWRGHGTVLVVDDEEAIRHVTIRMLEEMGFRALPAPDGHAAAALLGRHREDVRLVLLDLGLPPPDGEQTLTLLRQTGATPPVVLMSGHPAEEVARRLAGQGVTGFLQKPFRYNDLCAVVRQAVGAAV